MNQKTSKVEKEFYLRCSYLTLSVLFDKEPRKNRPTTDILEKIALIKNPPFKFLHYLLR